MKTYVITTFGMCEEKYQILETLMKLQQAELGCPDIEQHQQNQFTFYR